jgi:catechol 2,3-dioxygenase-like lactoylglutathione lyase family enzyme
MSQILKSTAVLAVEDLEASKRFYIDKLGFTEDLAVEGWSFLSRGACHLRIGDCPGIRPMSDCSDHSWFAYWHVDDARALYDEWRSKGVTIWHPISDTPWGMREFALLTPDGHRMVIGQELE